MAKDKVVIITGATGVGKSALALQLAQALGGEIINADSLALYRGFDIGTAKPSAAEQGLVPHHLIDVLNPDEEFDAASFLKKARPIITALSAKKICPLVCGGTGFYLRSLTKGLFDGPGRNFELRQQLAAERAAGVDLHARLAAIDPESAARLAPADYVRIERALEVFFVSGEKISTWQKKHQLAERPFDTLSLVIDLPLDELSANLQKRTLKMYQDGLLVEVQNLLNQGWSAELKPFKSIGYKEALAHLKGEISLSEAQEKTLLATRQYAKRQRTWFRGQMPEALYFHPGEGEKILETIKNFLTV